MYLHCSNEEYTEKLPTHSITSWRNNREAYTKDKRSVPVIISSADKRQVLEKQNLA